MKYSVCPVPAFSPNVVREDRLRWLGVSFSHMASLPTQTARMWACKAALIKQQSSLLSLAPATCARTLLVDHPAKPAALATVGLVSFIGATRWKEQANDLGHKSPGKEKEANWLPAPEGNFSIWLRAYWPDKAILDGTWKPPKIVRTSGVTTGAR